MKDIEEMTTEEFLRHLSMTACNQENYEQGGGVTDELREAAMRIEHLSQELSKATNKKN